MDKDQQKVVDLVTAGHNLVLLGQAGTGKTFTIRKCITKLTQMEKTIGLTCYTGNACLQYTSTVCTQAITLHKFAGLEDGRHSNSELLHLLKSDERFIEAKNRILSTDVLFIDEVSMVSAKTFSQVEFLCRSIRDSTLAFGSMQIILSGDFYQLPPIKDEIYGDFGHYCFQVDDFIHMFPHKIELSTVHRQTDPVLMSAISELEKGNPGTETNNLMSKLNRPLPATKKPVKLFARNIDVDLYNYTQLQNISNNIYTFKSNDEGDPKILSKMIATKTLNLKISAPVMLIKNLTTELVNGLTGTVVDIGPDIIYVDFSINGKNHVTPVTRCMFSKHDPRTKMSLASRKQFPLKLAYGITIHKSQGMTLPNLVVDCKHASQPGQIGVAIGRATSTSGLQVVNYKPSACRKHPSIVYDFYESLNVTDNIDSQLQCCKMHTIIQMHENKDDDDENINVTFSDSDVDDLTESQSFIDILSMMDDHKYAKPDEPREIEILSLLDRAMEDFMDTPSEGEALEAKLHLTKNINILHVWYEKEKGNVQGLFQKAIEGNVGNLKQMNFTSFYTNFHQHMNSCTYLQDIAEITRACQMSHQILTSIMFIIQSDLLKLKAAAVETSESNILDFNIPVEKEIASSGKGKLRYIGGYTIAKCKYRLSRTLHNSLFVLGMDAEVEKLQNQIQILENMTISASEIRETTEYEETLEETRRKQNISEGLTNIQDKTYEFFEFLETKTRSLLSHTSLIQKRKYLYRYVKNELWSDKRILEKFCTCYCYTRTAVDCDPESADDETVVSEVCGKIACTCSDLLVLLKMIINLYLSVSVAQFRKDFLTAVNREKSKALRKKVTERKSKSGIETKIDFQYIVRDESDQKIVSHLKLKSQILCDEQFLLKLTKKELMRICNAYGLEETSRKTKKALSQNVSNIIKQCSCIPHPNLLTEEKTSGTAQQESQSEIVMETQESEPQSGPSSITMEAPEPGLSSSTMEAPEPGLSSSTMEAPEPGPSSSTMEAPEPGLSKKSTASETKRKKSVCKKTARGKGKGKKKTVKKHQKLEVEDLCGICGKIYKKGEDWICCDSCGLWLHRGCVGLEDEDEWLTTSESVYSCPICV